MKTKSYLLITLAAMLTWSSCSLSKGPKTGWDEYELKGKVQTLCIKNYDAEMAFGDLTKGELRDSMVVSFTNDGKLLEVINYGNNGLVESTRIYTYDSNKTTQDYFEGGTLKRKYVDIYTDWGALKQETTYDAEGKMTWRNDYLYNENHQLEEITTYDDEGLWRKKKDYEYNDKGLVKKYKIYDKRGKLVNIQYFKYDEQGREIKSKEEDEAGEVGHTITHTYNKEGFPSSYSYDCKYFNHRYDYTYSYDKHGNYVVKYTSGELNGIQERTIQYF